MHEQMKTKSWTGRQRETKETPFNKGYSFHYNEGMIVSIVSSQCLDEKT